MQVCAVNRQALCSGDDRQSTVRRSRLRICDIQWIDSHCLQASGRCGVGALCGHLWSRTTGLIYIRLDLCRGEGRVGTESRSLLSDGCEVVWQHDCYWDTGSCRLFQTGCGPKLLSCLIPPPPVCAAAEKTTAVEALFCKETIALLYILVRESNLV